MPSAPAGDRRTPPKAPLVVPVVVIVSGLPCSGKTTLARTLTAALKLPLFTKDDIKELLFDTVGWSDREQSRVLSAASYALLFYLLEAQLAAGQNCIIEANFDPARHRPRFAELRRRHPFAAAEVHCVTAPEVLLQRFRERWQAGARHPGHLDDVTYPELVANVERSAAGGDYRHGRPLELGGPLWRRDTTDPTQLDDDALIAELAALLEPV